MHRFARLGNLKREAAVGDVVAACFKTSSRLISVQLQRCSVDFGAHTSTRTPPAAIPSFSRIMPASAYPRLFKACGLSQPDFEVFECHWNLARRRLVAPWCLSDSHQLSILSSTIQPPIIQVHKCLIKQPDVCFVSVRRVMCTKIVAHYRFPRERPAI